jgi:hypothetical protein
MWACALLLVAAIPALAQDQQLQQLQTPQPEQPQPGPQQPSPPTEPVEIGKSSSPAMPETAAQTTLRVAKEMNASMSIDTTTRIGAAVAKLQERLVEALKQKQVSAELATASAEKYMPPGDDEIALADAGIEADEIVERVGKGYAGVPLPLALMTVAERGGYVIAAAYIFSDNN